MASFDSIRIKVPGTKDGITLMQGNTKIGRTINFSTLPGRTCPKGIPCLRECYATKSLTGPNRATVSVSWGRNTKAMLFHRPETFHAINAWLKRSSIAKKTIYFRWHVSGDIIDQDYLYRMILIAKDNPQMHFLAFTKNFDVVSSTLDFTEVPKNLAIVYSMWPNWAKGHACKGRPRAWMVSKKHHDPAIPLKLAFWCDAQADEARRIAKADALGVDAKTLPDVPVTCAECRKCWHLGKREVIFKKH